MELQKYEAQSSPWSSSISSTSRIDIHETKGAEVPDGDCFTGWSSRFQYTHTPAIRRPLTRINTITKSLTWIRVYSGNDRLIPEFKEQEITWPAGCGLENMFKRACG